MFKAALAGLLLAWLPIGGFAIAAESAAEEQQAVQSIVERIYSGYTKASTTVEASRPTWGSTPDGYVPAKSAALNALVEEWRSSVDDDVFEMNTFDWYCQCQDYDEAKAHIVSQSYDTPGEGRILATVSFDVGYSEAQIMIFHFLLEGGVWTIDDLVFQGGEHLREGLESDLLAASLTNAT